MKKDNKSSSAGTSVDSSTNFQDHRTRQPYSNQMLREGLHEGNFFNEKGKVIKEFSLIKMFHFKGVNENGKGRKNYFMYKWVRKVEFNGVWTWVAFHLADDSGDYFHLRTIADENRVLRGVEVVQEPFA